MLADGLCVTSTLSFPDLLLNKNNRYCCVSYCRWHQSRALRPHWKQCLDSRIQQSNLQTKTKPQHKGRQLVLGGFALFTLQYLSDIALFSLLILECLYRTWRPFVNPSRDDDLILHHWEKTRTDPNEEYRFYKFNKAINLNEFTAEEYRSHLQDPDWTLEETNYLWDLCRRFDLRWVVIQDRYEWPPQEVDQMALQYYNGNKFLGKKGPAPSATSASTATTAPTGTDTISPSLLQPSAISSESAAGGTSTTTTPTSSTPYDVPSSRPQESTETAAPASTSTDVVPFTPAKIRSMEDLKNRYYTVNRILIKTRMTDGSQAMEKAHLLSSMNYDISREVERKKNLEILNTRTPEQIEVRGYDVLLENPHTPAEFTKS